MAIIQRILNLCKADIHRLVERMENRELLVKQYLRDMQGSLHVDRGNLGKITQQLESRQAEYTALQQELAKIEEVLDKALEEEKDDLARLLLRKRRRHSSILESLSSQIEALVNRQNELNILLQTREEQYEELMLRAKWGSPSPVYDEGSEKSNWTGTEDDIETELLRRKMELQLKGDKP